MPCIAGSVKKVVSTLGLMNGAVRDEILMQLDVAIMFVQVLIFRTRFCTVIFVLWFYKLIVS